jgi:hypothetical protein
MISFLFAFIIEIGNWVYSSVVVASSICEALGVIPSTEKRKKDDYGRNYIYIIYVCMYSRNKGITI